MDDKDIREQLPQEGIELQSDEDRRDADHSLDSDYRNSEEQIIEDTPEELNWNIKAIVREFEKIVADGEETSDSEPQPSEDGEPQPIEDSESQPLEDGEPQPIEDSEPQPIEDGEPQPIEDNKPQPPAVNEPSDRESDDRKLIQEMVSAMRELAEEVKQLRSQLEVKPHDPAHYSSERPPGLTTVSEDGSETETKAETQSEQNKTEVQSEQEKPVKKNKVLSIISNVLFYVVIVAMVLGAFLMRSTSKGEPFMIAGFSAANVLTSSMEDVYPRGSLIITKHMDAKELQIGDDITFMVSEDSSITHRIIGITENYQGTGARAFQTQGTKNPNPDKDMVAAANVVGKVIFHSKTLGDFANFVKENWPILLFILIVIIGLISFLKWNAKKSDEDDEEQKDEPKEKKPRSHTKKRNKHSERRSESNGDE